MSIQFSLLFGAFQLALFCKKDLNLTTRILHRHISRSTPTARATWI